MIDENGIFQFPRVQKSSTDLQLDRKCNYRNSQDINTSRNENCLKLTSPAHLLPPEAFDTHVHIFDPRVGPYAASRAYTPQTATLGELLAFNRSISSAQKPSNLVIVQPSPYRTDNSVLLSALEQLQGLCSVVRGIAVVDFEKTTDEQLHHMHGLGVRGLRLNMQSDGHGVDTSALRTLVQDAAARIGHLGWKLQLFAPAWVWQELFDCILELPVTVIADHTAGLLAASKLPLEERQHPLAQAGFQSVISLAKAGKVIVKVSGLYRSSTEATMGFADMAPLVRELAIQVPNSLIWASDWPHTGEGKDRLRAKPLDHLEPFRKIDNRLLLENIRQWVGSEENLAKMMIHNPRRVFA